MKKGFTLIELLGIILIIGLIALVSGPIIINTLKSTEKTNYEKFKKNLYLATESYLTNNQNKYKLNEPDDFAFIKLSELVNNEYLNKSIVNPKTKETINLNHTIFVKVLNDYTKKFEFTNTDASLEYASDVTIHYDGYYKPITVDNKLMWLDLKNNSDGEIINNTHLNWVDNKIKLNNVDNYIKVTKSSNIFTTDDQVSIELVYELINPEGNSLFRNSGLGLYYFDLYSDGLVRSMVRNQTNSANELPKATYEPLLKGGLHTLTVTMKKENYIFNFQYYGDGQKLNMSSNLGLKHGNKDFLIGKDDQDDLLTSIYIYSFRAYDRVLSLNEINSNHQKDKFRFEWDK